jgi:hypothetical protein
VVALKLTILPVAAAALIAGAVQAAALAPEALNSLSATPALLAAPVFDIQGKRIGAVVAVTPRPDGKLWSVTFRLANGTATQTVPASSASFDGQRVIVAPLRPGR